LGQKAVSAIRYIALFAVALFACDKRFERSTEGGGAPSPVAILPPVPPAAPWSAMPVDTFADAGAIDSRTAYEQSVQYEASGQLWMARLVLESQALSPSGTRDEAELLLRICMRQPDDACVEACRKKLGRPPREADREEDNRKKLEPKVLDGKASKEEIRRLRAACAKQGDRMCVALCDAKLR
jgi:hypothetical protein